MISLWAGQGVALARPGAAGQMVLQWWEEAKTSARALSARTQVGGA
jgi:nitronate monooxygenase